ncbi:hypothetical protein [Gordonia iterans]
MDSVAEEHGGVQPVLAALEGTSAEIASSTYYAYKARPASPRSIRDEELTKMIRKVHEENIVPPRV